MLNGVGNYPGLQFSLQSYHLSVIFSLFSSLVVFIFFPEDLLVSLEVLGFFCSSSATNRDDVEFVLIPEFVYL